jgi:D-alanyl-D-alanine carboxypeptidase
MLSGRGAPRGLRLGLFGCATVVAYVALSAHPADARSWRRHSVQNAAAPTSETSPRYADIVIDANTGTVLHASNADSLRHPASLTKIMTLYMLFERLEAGKLKLDSELDVSAHAAAQSPTKLGLRAGDTITVEHAIKGIVTRSANDAAVVIAESLADSEEDFARMMTRKAAALGMSRTVYRNASGLPNPDQVTTARDQATLGRAIQERFPRYYPFFSTRVFLYQGHAIGNHNRLLGKVEGVDGIKTGYINASGFNIVTSVHRDNRYLVAAVFGGSSAGSRDARMRDLIGAHIVTASTRRTTSVFAELKGEPRGVETRGVETRGIETRGVETRGVETRSIEPKIAEPKIAETKIAEPKVAEAKPPKPGFATASAASQPVRLDPVATAAVPPRATATTGSTEPIRPVPVKTLMVRPGGQVQTASMAPLYLPPLPRTAEVGAEPPVKKPEPPPPVRAAAPAATAAVATAPSYTAPMPPARPQQVRSGWMIQVGAYPAETEAKQRLSTVKSKAAKLLAGADAFTETVQKGSATLYRARFAGLDKDGAEAACKYLKRNDVDCVTIHK